MRGDGQPRGGNAQPGPENNLLVLDPANLAGCKRPFEAIHPDQGYTPHDFRGMKTYDVVICTSNRGKEARRRAADIFFHPGFTRVCPLRKHENKRIRDGSTLTFTSARKTSGATSEVGRMGAIRASSAWCGRSRHRRTWLHDTRVGGFMPLSDRWVWVCSRGAWKKQKVDLLSCTTRYTERTQWMSRLGLFCQVGRESKRP